MPTFTVLGVYHEPLGQRYAQSIEAPDPQRAERAICEQAESELLVAAVIEGDVHPVDVAYARLRTERRR